MNDQRLRDLFEEVLVDEPAEDAAAYEDLARGRAARVRRRRRRVAGTVAVTAAAAAVALAVPVSPLSLIDVRGPAVSPATGDSADLPPEVADDPIKLALWKAVDKALPADIHVEEPVGATDGGVYVALVRDGLSFGLTVWLQEARPDLEEFRPCSTPTPVEFYVQSSCEEGYDGDGRWRVMAEALDGRYGVAILEGGPASVTLRWDRVGYPPPDCEGDVCQAVSEEDVEVTGNLTTVEAGAIAEGAWSVGARYSPADLATGIDLEATFDQWPDLVTTLESALEIGELTPAEPSGVVADIDGQIGSITGSYATADGETVDVLVWQKERLYDPFCADRTCNFLPDQSMSTDDRQESSNIGRASLGSIFGLGLRAGLEIWVDSPDPSADQGLADAQWQLEQLVPSLRDREP